MSNPERFRVALQSASSDGVGSGAASRSSRPATRWARENAGVEWPGGQPAPIFDVGTGPTG